MPPQVVIPAIAPATQRVLINRVHSILSNRKKDGGEEQYLVRWKTDTETQYPPLSWHSLNELARCLEQVQDYLDSKVKKGNGSQISRKRKSPDSESNFERHPSPMERHLHPGSRNTPASRASSASTEDQGAYTSDVYNGVLDTKDGLRFARSAFGSNIAKLDIQSVPTPEMAQTAWNSNTDRAEIMIRAEYTRRLRKVPGVPIHLVNIHDSTTPSLRFHYITDYVLRDGVYKADNATQQGCTQCSPHMGRSIGCEYTKKCDCLEYAAVDESRLDDEQRMLYEIARENGDSTIGFPKKFPYFAEGTKIQRAGCLVPFYLNSRHPIYECNDKCHCGPDCRNKNVQFGRTVELEIFKTAGGRGWGLRCRTDLFKGQFIDTYRGEIITDEEANRRENTATSKTKSSYLYSLDKFQKSEGILQEDVYVVDGEFMGGPTKFMNHSCEPNCRQYTVHYNKHDCRVYDIALFACQDIPKGTELTFNYRDSDDEPVVEPGVDPIPCLCGAENCRKWLWT